MLASLYAGAGRSEVGGWTLDFGLWTSAGGDVLGAGSVGLGTGGLVAVGEGCGGSSPADLVGEGSGRVEGLLLFELALTFWLALMSSSPMSMGVWPATAEAFLFSLVLAG